MANVKANKRQKEAYLIESLKTAVFVKLDEAIDDIENGRVIAEDEMWEELDKI